MTGSWLDLLQILQNKGGRAVVWNWVVKSKVLLAMCCQPGRLETLLGLLPVSSSHNRRWKEKSWLLLSHRITFFFPLYLFLFSSSWHLEVTGESHCLTDKKSHDTGLSLLLELHLLLCFSVPKVRAMAKRVVPASAQQATLPKSVVAFLIHWFFFTWGFFFFGWSL